MIPANFEYTRAATVDEALSALGQAGTMVISGGQSLIPLMRFRRIQPQRLIDIGALAELRGVSVEHGIARIGAATTYRELIASKALHTAVPLVPEVSELVGDLQLRNLGTIGGALVYADPFADMPAVMMALDATFHLQSLGGRRDVAARDFFRGPFQTALMQGELLVAISIRVTPRGTGTAYANFEKSASGYSQVGVAAVVSRGRDGIVTAASVAITSVAPTPFLVGAASTLVGSDGSASLISQVAVAAVAGVTVHPDAHTTSDYRVHLAAVAVRRAVTTALERATS